MRVTISHTKTQEEAKRVVDQTVDQVLQPTMPTPIKMTDVQKRWDGTTCHFSLTARMGPMSAPIRGTIWVAERDITIECDLPPLLTAILPERVLQAGVESRVRGLLGGKSS